MTTTIEPKRQLRIGATGGTLIGLVAPYEPCECGAGHPDDSPTQALYASDDGRASLQCNRCGAWRVL